MSTIETDIVIAGAGVSGLVAAKTLIKKGLSVIVVEASGMVGGRVKSHRKDGFILDHGFQVLLTAYPQAQKHLRYADLDLCMFPRGASTYHKGMFTKVTDPREDLKAAANAFGPVLKPSDLSPLWRLCRLDGAGKSQVTTAQYLDNAGFSDTLKNTFLAPFLRGILLDPKLTAPVDLLSFYMQMFATGRTAIPAQGMSAIPAQLAQAVPVENLRLNSAVEAIENHAVILSDETTIRCRGLVSALDPMSAGRLAGIVPAAAFHHTVCHYFSAPDGDVSDMLPLVLDGSGSGPVNHLAIPSKVSDAYAPTGKALIGATEVGVTGSGNLAAVKKQLFDWYGPRASAWKHLESISVPNSLPAQSEADQWHNFASSLTQKLKMQFSGPVVAAGDFTTSASLNGAMLSGEIAAEDLLSQITTPTEG